MFVFHNHPPASRENNPDGVKEARQRIAGLSNPYLAHAAPSKEDLVGAVQPVSPAAEASNEKPSPSTPFTLTSSEQPSETSEASTDDAVITRENVLPELAHLLPPVHGAVTQQAAAHPVQPAAPVIPANPLEQLAAAAPKTTARARRKRPDTAPKSLPSRFMPLVVGVVTFVLVLLAAKAPVLLNQFGYLTQDKPAPIVAPAQAGAVTVPPEPVISIPKINVNAPVIYTDNNAESVIQKHLENGVVHYDNTALPGTNGNSVIFRPLFK